MLEVKMPALSPTMEKGTLARWLVKVGDTIRAGDMIAEIETDKATMELEVDEGGRIASLVVVEGTAGVAVGSVVALLAGEGEAGGVNPADEPAPRPAAPLAEEPAAPSAGAAVGSSGGADRIRVSPLAARIAKANDVDLAKISGSGPNGRIVAADLGLALRPSPPQPAPPAATPAPAIEVQHAVSDVPHELTNLSGMRRTIARRLTESKQQVPHIYLTVDVRLDALLSLRQRLNEALAARGIKLSVNDLAIKALALALTDVPQCNVQFAGDCIARFQRVDVSVAVSIPGGLITPIIADAGAKSLSSISAEMSDLAARAREGKLRPEEFQGGTASLSNLGMYGIRQFEAVINPPQAMIMALGAGEPRHIVTRDGHAEIAKVLSATGSFDHRAVDGVDAAMLMQAFRQRMEEPLAMIA